ncbi:MAG: DNA-directed RNA polymerase subunit alpha [Sulfurospirillum sp.]|nr:DNA-directed RNA polymerase subunit alpha [Sulfurospirillum sp.]MBL0702786.1 DNA-directed RNA polymerase subunit alpha [Sulfurospirillum sp.]
MQKISTVAYMPTEIEIEKISDKKAKIVAYPFEAGFAITLAHPLRRLLLSSTVGFAPIAIKIEGVTHEFDSMRGMLEDVALFIINLKNVRFKIKNDEKRVEVNYSFDGAKEIYGKDLSNETIEVVTPEGYLATINEDAKLNFSLILENGMGYVPSEVIRDLVDSDYIALDAFFTPVKKAIYNIENILVEDNPNFEKVIFTVETDGLISPIEAFKNSLKAMYAQMSVFNSVLDIKMPSIKDTSNDSIEIDKLLQSIEELNLSARSFNCLDKAEIKFIGELVLMSEIELKNLKNLGKKSLEEISASMQEIGFPVGSDFLDDTAEVLKKKIEDLKSNEDE